MDKVSFRGAVIQFYQSPQSSLNDRKIFANSLLERISLNFNHSEILRDDSFTISNGHFDVETFDIVQKPSLSFFKKAKLALKAFVIHDKKDGALEILTVTKDKNDDLIREIHEDAQLFNMPFSMLNDSGLKTSEMSMTTHITDESSLQSMISEGQKITRSRISE